MSPRYCGKVAYRRRGAAEAALRTIRRTASQQEAHTVPVRVYLHEECGRWHLTSQP